MRRFLMFMALLILTLLVGKSASAHSANVWASPVESNFDSFSRLYLPHGLGSFDERPTRHRSTRRSRDFPREVGGEVEFRLRDRDYERVYINGTFTAWDDLEMERKGRVWQIRIPLERGRHRYTFVIETGRETRTRTDPSNPNRTRGPRRRWVSEIRVDRDGDVRTPHDDFDFDLDLVESVLVDFQRVDGFSLGLRSAFQANQEYSPSVKGSLEYGFESERWSGELSLRQPVTAEGDVRVRATVYDKTDFTNQTGVGDWENLISSWIVREDNRDYYQREGISLGVAVDPRRDVSALVEYRVDDYTSLEREVRGGWFGDADQRLNPPVDEGTMRSLVVAGRFGSELRHFAFDFEYSDPSFASSAYDFTVLTAQYRTRFRLGRHQHVDVRLKMGGNLNGTLPVQRQFQVGGLGTVRGYGYQSLLVPADDGSVVAGRGGQRMALANVEYAFGIDDDLQFIVLFDSGTAWQDDDAGMDVSDFESSAGVGVQFGEYDGLRIDFIKAFDGRDILVQARLNRPF